MFDIFKSPKKQEKFINIDINDPLVIKLQQNLSSEEQKMFVNSFFCYLNFDQTKDFVVDLEEVYSWIGYSRKGTAKDILKREFELNIDYIVNTDKQLASENSEASKHGGTNREQILMNIDTFKQLCALARTPVGKKIRKYYIKMEEIMFEYTKEQVKVKELEYQQQLQEKELELVKYKEKVYEEIEKTGHIYVIKTDGGTKVGKTKDAVKKRIKGLQTGNMNDIQVLLDFKTSNADLLEKTVHYILERYRCNSNREFFDCDVDFIKTVVETIGKVVDTLKSCYQQITKEQILTKLSENGININLEINSETESEKTFVNEEKEESELYNWLNNNIELDKNGILKLKKICELYMDMDTVHSKLSNKIRLEIEKWIKTKYKNINHQYHISSYNGERYKGWVGLKLK
jgi:phage anti-repressor protein